MTLIKDKVKMDHSSEKPLKQIIEAQSLSQLNQSLDKYVRESTSCEVSRHVLA